MDGNTFDVLGLIVFASDDEPPGRDAAAAFAGVTMLNMVGLLRRLTPFLSPSQPYLSTTLVVSPATVAK